MLDRLLANSTARAEEPITGSTLAVGGPCRASLVWRGWRRRSGEYLCPSSFFMDPEVLELLFVIFFFGGGGGGKACERKTWEKVQKAACQRDFISAQVHLPRRSRA